MRLLTGVTGVTSVLGGWGFLVALVQALVLTLMLTLIFALLPLQAAHAAQSTVFGPKTASISPNAKSVGSMAFADIDVYSPGRDTAGPFTLVIENSSANLPNGKQVRIEIWHNLVKVASSSDFFSPNGVALASFQKPINARPLRNLVMVKVLGNTPVRFTYKIVAGAAPLPPASISLLVPNPLALTNGSSAVLTATLTPAPSSAGSIDLVSSNTAVLTLPNSVAFSAGQTSVAISVQAQAVGTASVTASLNGGSASSSTSSSASSSTSSNAIANVNVSPAAPKLMGLLPIQSTLQQGASGQMQLSIAPNQSQDTRVALLSSDSTKVSVQASVTIPAGQTTASFAAQGLAVGNAQISASLNNAAGLSSASAQVQVVPVPVPPTVVSVLPVTLVLQKGSTAQLVVKLSAAQSSDTTVALLTRTSGIVSLPASVVVPAGASQVGFNVSALDVGNSLIAARLSLSSSSSSVESAVQVTPVPAALAGLTPASSSLIVGANGQLLLQLNNAQSSVTTVALAAAPSGIVQLPATVLVPAGQTQVNLTVTALAVGRADVVATLNGSTQRAGVLVSPLPAAIAEVSPSPLALQEGASGNFTVRLNAVQSSAVTINLVAANPSLLRAPATFVIPAGVVSQAVSVQALAAGSTQLTVGLNGASLSVAVNITLPPPRIAALEPATQDLPKGKLGQLRLTLDRAPQAPALVSLVNSNSAALGLPAQVTIPAGQLSVDIPMTALSLGQAYLSAALNGSAVNAVVTVVAPEIVGIALTPAAVSVSPGQSTQVQAMGTYSDGSTQDITASQGTAWTSAAPATATVSAEGRVTGLATGETLLSASQTVLPTYGNPTPSAVVGQASITVGSPLPLALSAIKTALTTGESVAVSISAPYAAGAQAFVIILSSNGTAALQYPSSVSINPGLSSVNVNLKATSAGSVVLTASASANANANANANTNTTPFASGQLSFSVTDPAPTSITITAVSPNAGAVGSLVTLSGIGFTAPVNGNNSNSNNSNTVTFAGNVPAVVQSASTAELVVKVPDAAQSGPITVSNSLGSAQSAPFTVLREQDFSFQASPSMLDVIQGTSASVVLNLASVGTNNFQGLAKLTATGLPAGVTAQFDPPSLSAYQTGRLTLLADSRAALTSPNANANASANVTLTAQATLNGLPWVRQSSISVRVVSKEGLTGVKGRFVTPAGAGIAGIIARQDITTNQVVTDAAGNFTLTGLAPGVTTLRFDATPANPLYPIWPFNVTLAANQVLTLTDWVINAPPTDEQFKQIDNAVQDQQITDDRYPGFAVTMPAGVSIVGWDGVKKPRIAVQRIDPDKLPVGAPPFPMKEAYQLYFGTPMGGIPSAPIPVTLPNVAEKEPGEKVDIWWFDGSPMGGTGEWKMAGLGTVSADGKTVSSDPGVGITRFCGVCGLFSLSCPPNPTPPQPCPTCGGQDGTPANDAGNPVSLFTGQALARSSGLSIGGLAPVQTTLHYNPVDAFNNRAGTVTSFGYGWTFGYDISFWPMSGEQKRLVMPGGQFVNMVADNTGTGTGNNTKYRPVNDPRYSGAYAQMLSAERWEVVLKDGTRWQFEPFPGIPGLIRGGPPLFVTKIIDSNGVATSISRQSNGRIQSISGLDGRGISASYGSNGFVSRLADHTGRHQDYGYTADGRVNQITDPQGRVTQYSYQSLPTFTNPDGATACSAEIIDNNHQGITSVLYPSSTTPTRNSYGTDRILKQTTATGETWQFAYRRTGACVVKLSGQSLPAKVWDYSCRAGQSLASRTCSGGTCTAPEVGTCPDTDSEDNRAAGWRFYGGTVQEAVVTQPDATTTRSTFNARGVITAFADELGQRSQFIYDPKQQLTKSIDPLGRETKFEYDALGNRTATIDPLGHRTETLFTASNKPSQTTRFWLEKPSTQGGVALSYTPIFSSASYDSKGNLTQTINEVGLQTRLSYSAQGLLSSATLAAQINSPSVPVVSAGVASSIAPAARQISLSYSNAGDLSLITDREGNDTRLGTDALGRPSSSTNPLGYTSQTEYNVIDQLTTSTNPLGQTSQLSYDPAGRITAVTNTAGVQIERYSYDSQGRVISKTDALNQSDTFEWGSFSRPIKTTDRKGQVTTRSYNERGQVASITTPDKTISFEYDTVGRLSEVRDPSSVNTTKYDAANRITQTDSTTAAGSHRLQYQYDSLGRVSTRTLSGSGIIKPEVTTYSWDAADRLLGHSSSFGVGTGTGTGAGAGTGTGTQVHSTSYTYDSAGRLATRKVQAGNQQDLITQAYGYDGLERLSQIKYLKAQGTASEQLIEQIDYQYDAAGQRIAKTTLNGNGTGSQDTPMRASFDAANRMRSITFTGTGTGTSTGSSDTSYSLSYDQNGNLTQKQNQLEPNDKTTYAWDANNRLIQMNQSKTISSNIGTAGTTGTTGNTSSSTSTTVLSASFSYDAFGRRIQSTITQGTQAPTTVQYLYEGAQALGEIRDGKLSHRLLTGLSLDETIARIAVNGDGNKDAANSRLYLTDALNSVIAQLADDDNANIQNSYAYSPYGQSQTVGPDSANNPNQYTSRENDNTGLYYYRARYYDPVMKRFVSSDPIGLAGGMNSYSYVEGDPVNYLDPLGFDRWGDTSANYRYTQKAGKPVDDTTGTALTCFSICVGGANPGPGVTVTAGQEGGHSRGSAHETGQACDVGKNSNPNLTRSKTEQCFKQCFPASSSWGQEERNHYHMQTRPSASGSTGFIPGVH
ncbi:RHS repeat-associated core domain-containing protein [Polaromonas vacuolata]|uniref:RHS repeat-associated core domain-containing protein n=1 Tax=Polaromonas vacuolata TaxID=37448 RepID=UPI0014578ED0|nr:RHS repeat-associated core domain-containing protein [Polaromonas vacuolata]